MRDPIKIIAFDGERDEIVRRLVTGVIHQWDRIPKHVQDDILKDAVLAGDGSDAGSLRAKLTAFIHSQAGDQR